MKKKERFYDLVLSCEARRNPAYRPECPRVDTETQTVRAFLYTSCTSISSLSHTHAHTPTRTSLSSARKHPCIWQLRAASCLATRAFVGEPLGSHISVAVESAAKATRQSCRKTPSGTLKTCDGPRRSLQKALWDAETEENVTSHLAIGSPLCHLRCTPPPSVGFQTISPGGRMRPMGREERSVTRDDLLPVRSHKPLIHRDGAENYALLSF